MIASRKTISLGILALFALGLRVSVVLVLRTEHAAPITYEHGQIAENLLAGRGFTIEFLGREGPTSQQAPFYPGLLAAAYACFGVDSPAATLAVQLLQCVAGTALVLAVVWLGWVLVPDRPGVGWVAGIGAAVYPTHLYMVTHMQVALWAALLLTTLLALVMSARWRATWWGAVVGGCLAGALLLVEPILALALPVCGIAFWLGEGIGEEDGRWAGRFRVLPLARAGLMAAVAGLIVAPWLVRNRRVHGEWVFVKSSFGYAFWQANNPLSWGTDKVPTPSAERLRREHDGTLAGMDRALWEARHETVYIDDLLLRPTGYRELAGLSEPERSRRLGRRAVAFIRANPARYAELCLNRLRYFLLFDETNPKASNRIYRAATVTWLVLALVGLLVSRDRWRRLWPTYAIFLLVTLFHALVITSVRFRIPLEPLSFVWAAWAVVPFGAHFVGQRRLRIYRPGEHRPDSAHADGGLAGPHWDRRRRRRAA